jgi:Tol biopolymer transport system component
VWSVDLAGHVRLVQRVPGRLYIEDISKDGRVLEEHDFSRVGILYRGPDDSAERDLSWLDLTALTALSGDGRRVLFSEVGEAAGGRRLVYLRDTSGAEAVRLGEGLPLSLSADGKSVLAISEEGNLAILPTGAGQPRTVQGPGKLHEAAVILPDGRMLCWAQESGHASRLYLQEGANWKPISPEFGDPRAQFQTVLSPAGDRVAALHGKDLMLVSLPTGEVHTVSGWSDSHIAGWTADGKSLYQARANGDHFEILKFNLETQKAEPWKRIDVKGVTPAWIRVTPDGQHYAYTYQVAAADAFVVTGLK